MELACLLAGASVRPSDAGGVFLGEPGAGEHRVELLGGGRDADGLDQRGGAREGGRR